MCRIVILGAAGFIGTNLIKKLSADKNNYIYAVDENVDYFVKDVLADNVELLAFSFLDVFNYDSVIKNADVVFYLISTNNPSSSNINIGRDITDNVTIAISILESCVKNQINKVVFLSSGGTVYGKADSFPINESHETNPITTYGVQKLTIEKLLYVYNYVHGLDYSIIRLSNPYGPYQRPNGRLGALTTFIYKAINKEPIDVYGDGSVVRDYIYIDDAINGILNVTYDTHSNKIFNIGSGKGTSINELLVLIGDVLDIKLNVNYMSKRSVDLPINYLDISRYEQVYGKTIHVSLEEGIRKTADFLSGRNMAIR